MFVQNLRAKIGARLNGDSEAGFTLIELLVVMLILGILAAIALPAFFNQREKAGDSKAKENAHSAQVAVETYSTENNGSYENVDNAAAHAIEPTIEETAPAAGKEGVTIEEGENSSSYVITSVSSNGHTFEIINKSGTMEYLCEPEEKGGCPAEGDWSK